MKSIDKLKQFAKGGQIRKYGLGDAFTPEDEEAIRTAGIHYSMDESETENYENWLEAGEKLDDYKVALKMGRKGGNYGTNEDGSVRTKQDVRAAIRDARRAKMQAAREDGVMKGRLNASAEKFESAMSSPGAKIGLQAAVGAVNMIDDMAMGDKNFGAQSEAIDNAVHAASSALMQSGNPYAMVAGAALEGANFLTKAGGQTVQGFDVDINSSGYGQMGHMESSSSRDFGAMIGLGGIFGQNKMKDKLAKRNAQAKMAMNAANIANDQSFEQEARANSIQNTIMNNNIALAGGLDTSLLGG